MNILITGGTGMVGRSLCQRLISQGHTVSVISRQPHRVSALCSGATGISDFTQISPHSSFDAVINLAGAPIADRRWSSKQREQLRDSRIELTNNLVRWMKQQSTPPPVLISASATGWYGDRGDELLDEHSQPSSNDFASQLCLDWEESALQVGSVSRVVLLRIAPVLAQQGGMLTRLRLPFSFGLGGRLGSGTQWMPWIHLHDLVRLIEHLLHQTECSGVYNACAPLPVTNAEFTKCLATVLKRPAVLPAPAWALKMLLGEMSILLLGGQNLRPLRTQQSGFNWNYPKLQQALQQCVSR